MPKTHLRLTLMQRLALGFTLTWLIWWAYPTYGRADVTTLGGDSFRTHRYYDDLGSALCLSSSHEVGPTLSQPVIIYYGQPLAVRYEGKQYHVDTVVYHLGSQELFAFTPDGTVIARRHVQNVKSWGFITYSKGTSGILDDVLYLTTSDPGVAAFSPAALLGLDVHELALTQPVDEQLRDRATVFELGRYKVPGKFVDQNNVTRTTEVLGIVSAPLDLGGDRIVFGVVEDRVIILRGLASAYRPKQSAKATQFYASGWNSGSATEIDKDQFVMAVSPGVVRFYMVEHSNATRDFDERWHKDFVSPGLSQITRDPFMPDALYLSSQNGDFFKIDARDGVVLKEQTGVPGFINTGQAVDQNYVYFGMRWLSGNTRYGRLVAVDRAELELAWENSPSDLSTDQTQYAWINVDPVVWSSSDPRENRSYVITGDNGGALSAWAAAGSDGQPGGAPANLFLTDADSDPMNCAAVESDSPDFRAPAFKHSPRTILTRKPEIRTGADAWQNFQGVATGTAISGGRLYSGYINKGEAADSAMVAFRTPWNLSLQKVELELLEDGKAIPVGDNFRLFSLDKVRAKVTVRLEGDSEAGAQQVKVFAGWNSGGPEAPNSVTISPFQTTTVEFNLTVPADTSNLKLIAVVNPAVYDGRRDHEAGIALYPPTVKDQSQVPDPLPQAWKDALKGESRYKEIWALDNAVTRSFATIKACDLTVDINQPAQGAEVPRDFNVGVTVRRSGCEDQANATIWMSMNKTTQGELPVTFAGNQTSAVFRLEAQPEGPITLVARVDSRNSIIETNEQNNQSSSTFSVRDDPSASCDPKTPPEDCVISVPGN